MKVRVLLVITAAMLATPASANELPEKYRATLRRGLDFLVEKQHKDGHWESEDGKYPVAITALVGMAFLMDTLTSSGNGC